MDDLKLFAKNDQQLQGLLKIVNQFSDDLRMEFGLDKCAKATCFRGKLLKAKNITLDTAAVIKTGMGTGWDTTFLYERKNLERILSYGEVNPDK